MTTERKSVPTITRQKNYHEIKEIYSNLIILRVATTSQTAFRFVVLNKTAYHLFIPFPKKHKCFSGSHLRFENEQKRSFRHFGGGVGLCSRVQNSFRKLFYMFSLCLNFIMMSPTNRLS